VINTGPLNTLPLNSSSGRDVAVDDTTGEALLPPTLNSGALNTGPLNGSSGEPVATGETTGETVLPLPKSLGSARTKTLGYGAATIQLSVDGKAESPYVATVETTLATLSVDGKAESPYVATVETTLATLSVSGEVAVTGNYGGASVPLLSCEGEGGTVNLVSGDTLIKLKASGEIAPFRLGRMSVSLPLFAASGFSGSASAVTCATTLPALRVHCEATNPPMCAGDASLPLPRGSGLAHVSLLAQGSITIPVPHSNGSADNPALVSGDTRIRLLSTGETVRSQWGSVFTVAPLFQCNGYADGPSPPVSATTAMASLRTQGVAVSAFNTIGVVDAPKLLVTGNGTTTNFGRSTVVIQRLKINGAAHNAAHCEAACRVSTFSADGIARHSHETLDNLAFDRGCSGVIPTMDSVTPSPFHYERCA
jgi:hypothetical protein